MNTTAFRILLVVSIALPFVGGFSDHLFPSLLSSGLSQASEAEPTPFALNSWAGVLLLVTWALAGIVGAIGMFMFRPWARTLTLWLTISGFAIYPVLGSSVHSWLSSALTESGAMAWGAMLAFAYSEPIKSHFPRRPNDA